MCAPLHQPPPGLPHARGGVSVGALPGTSSEASSPRTWGCFRHGTRHAFFFAGLPHARGGVSSSTYAMCLLSTSSPRTWGCFSDIRPRESNRVVFPTHVGVFLTGVQLVGKSSGLPHARGGVSRLMAAPQITDSSSPRTWGCFPLSRGFFIKVIVFPTHVGVFLSHKKERKRLDKSSPRTWGCFSTVPTITAFPIVFPTHVGVFLLKASSHKVSRSSPRTWGCFFHLPALRTSGDVFPTHVGVFLLPPISQQ